MVKFELFGSENRKHIQAISIVLVNIYVKQRNYKVINQNMEGSNKYFVTLINLKGKKP